MLPLLFWAADLSASQGGSIAAPVSQYMRPILRSKDEATFKANVNLEIGTDVQAYDVDLTTWAGITPHVAWQDILDGTLTTPLNAQTARTSMNALPVYHSDDYTSINAAVTAIGSTSATLYVTTSETLTANLTIPATCAVRIDKGGMIVKASTYTLTINGSFEAGLYQCFSGFTTATLARVERVVPQWFGAKGDVIGAADGVAVATDATFTSATATWTAADVGKSIYIIGAGTAGAALSTTIASINSATSIELTVAASTSVNPATYTYGTDDSAAIQAAIDTGRRVRIPAGRYLCGDLDVTTDGQIIEGDGFGIYDVRYDEPPTSLVAKSGSSWVIRCLDAHGAQLRNLGIDCNRVSTLRAGAYHSGGWYVTFDHVSVGNTDTGKDGILIDRQGSPNSDATLGTYVSSYNHCAGNVNVVGRDVKGCVTTLTFNNHGGGYIHLGPAVVRTTIISPCLQGQDPIFQFTGPATSDITIIGAYVETSGTYIKIIGDVGGVYSKYGNMGVTTYVDTSEGTLGEYEFGDLAHTNARATHAAYPPTLYVPKTTGWSERRGVPEATNAYISIDAQTGDPLFTGLGHSTGLGGAAWTITQSDPNALKSQYGISVNIGDALREIFRVGSTGTACIGRDNVSNTLSSADLTLAWQCALGMKERTTTPASHTGFGKLYPKNDGYLHWQHPNDASDGRVAVVKGVSHNYAAGTTAWTMTVAEAAATLFTVTNASGAADAVFPAAVPGKQFTVYNNSGQAITFKVTGQTGVAVPNGAYVDLVMNATDVTWANTIPHTLAGVSNGATHLGTFTGTTIPDSSDIKQGLQALETAVETKLATVVAANMADADHGDVAWASGVATVQAASDNFTVGTTAAGKNLTVNATLGSNIVSNGTFDSDLTGWAGANWAQSAGTALHTAGATTALSQAAATVVSGTTYKLTFDVVGGTTGTVTPSFGGFTGTARNFGSASYTQYGTASATTALAFTPTSAFDGAIDNVVLVALTNATGDADIYGNLRVYSPIQSPDGTDTITVSKGNVGIGTTVPGGILELQTGDSNADLIIDSGSKAAQVSEVRFYDRGTAEWAIGKGANNSFFINEFGIATHFVINPGGNVGIGTASPATKLDQGQFSANALGSYHTFSKSRHATAGSHTIVQDNDVLGGIQGAASDGVDFGTIPARIHFEVDDASPAASSIGGAVVISTAAGAASDDLTERVRIDAAGMMTVTGDLTITGDDIFATTNTLGALWVADGTNYNPVVMSGDATIAANGAVTIAADAVESSMIGDYQAVRLLGVADANMTAAAAKTTVYTVPAGKSAIVTMVIVRNPTASLAAGVDYSLGDGANADTWKTTIDLSAMTATTECIIIQPPTAKFTVFDATDAFGIKPATGSTATALATVYAYGIEF